MMQLFTVSEYIAFSLYSVILTFSLSLALSFQLRTFVCALLTLGATAPSLAVVHGIVPPPPLGSNSLPSSSNTGYRYNGPAHKYLPAASAPATEAVTTTGHWQPNALQAPSLEQQLPYEHVYSSTPAPEEQQQGQGYNGPYSMQYYEGGQQQQHSNRPQQQQYQQQYDSSREQLSSNSWQQQPPRQQQQLLHNYWQQQQHLPGNAWKQQQLDSARQQQLHLNLNLDEDNDNSNELNPFQFATSHKVAAAPATAGHAVASYALSAGTHSPRPVELDVRDVGLMTQALPEPHQQQLFAAPASYEQQLGGSSGSSSGSSYVQMQSHSYELPPSISSSYSSSGSSTAQREYPASAQQHQQHRQQQQHAAAAAEYATTGQPYPESSFFHGSSASSSPSHSSHAYPSSHSDSHANYSPSYPSHSSYPSPSSSHSSYPSLSYAPPSREFQAPYY